MVESEGMVTEVYQESEDEQGEGEGGEREEGEEEEVEDEDEKEEGDSEVEEEMVGDICWFFTVTTVMFFRGQRSVIVRMTERTWRKRSLTSR